MGVKCHNQIYIRGICGIFDMEVPWMAESDILKSAMGGRW